MEMYLKFNDNRNSEELTIVMVWRRAVCYSVSADKQYQFV